MGPRKSLGSFLSVCTVIAASLVFSSPAADAVSPGPLVYGVNPFNNQSFQPERGLQAFDAFTGDLIGGAKITIVGGPLNGDVIGATGLAVDPTTSIAYTLLRMNEFENPRILASIDLSNGNATTIGDTGRRLTSLTFDTTGTLYASEGGGNFNPHACPHCLLTLDKTTAAPTFAANMTACPNPGSACGHGIAFNTDDGMIYHTSGQEADPIFEKIDPANAFTKTSVGYTGAIPDTIYGIGYDDPNNRFIAFDWNGAIHSVTAAGVSTLMPVLEDDDVFLKGLHIATGPVPTDIPPTAVNDTATMDEGEFSLPIDVLANDTDPDAGEIEITSVTQPANGNVGVGGGSNDSPPQIFYTPDSTYCNDGSPTDDFTYTLSGGSTATVSVTVNCIPFEGPIVFGVNPFGNSDSSADGGLQGIDAGTGLVERDLFITVALGSAITGDVNSATALAVDPRTGLMYAALNMFGSSDNSVLATVDPSDGVAITVGDMDENVDAMTFGTNGTLYAVASDSADNCFHCLYVVNKDTATMKRVKQLPDTDTAAIAYNPLDKKIYRAGYSTFDVIDPARKFAVKDIGYGGPTPLGTMGMGFDARLGAFRLIDDSEDLWQVATNGGAIFTGVPATVGLRGLVVSEPTLTLKYSATKRRITGRLMTPGVSDCDGSRDVSVWRDTTGPDVLVGEVSTSGDGTYLLAQRLGKGKYFATVDDAPPVGDLPCPDATSKSITVR